MVAFRNGVTQALRRAGYHASFVCRPPFPNVMASGWHLHQSLHHLASGASAFCRDEPAAGSGPGDAVHVLSDAGAAWLAGLLEHGRSMAVFCAPTINAYGRFRPNAMAPNALTWGRDNRGAMLRVLGRAGDAGTRIENRIGEPGANPYLYIAAQIHAGLDGLERRLEAPKATAAPYAQAPATEPTACPRASARRWPRSPPTSAWWRPSARRSWPGTTRSSAPSSPATTRPRTRMPGRRASTSAASRRRLTPWRRSPST